MEGIPMTCHICMPQDEHRNLDHRDSSPIHAPGCHFAHTLPCLDQISPTALNTLTQRGFSISADVDRCRMLSFSRTTTHILWLKTWGTCTMFPRTPTTQRTGRRHGHRSWGPSGPIGAACCCLVAFFQLSRRVHWVRKAVIFRTRLVWVDWFAPE